MNRVRAALYNAWDVVHSHIGGFGIFATIVMVIPLTTMCIAYGRWPYAFVVVAVSYVMVRGYRAEDRKREDARNRRMQAQFLVDVALVSLEEAEKKAEPSSLVHAKFSRAHLEIIREALR